MPPTISFAPNTKTSSVKKSSIYQSAQPNMSSTVSKYYLAHSARSKLSREAARADHDLRLLVGHANMLDSLMIDLANAEQEQERWYNRSLSGVREQEAEVSHEGTIMEEPEVDWEAEDAESSDESDYEEEQIKPAHPYEMSSREFDMELDDEEDQSLSLTRTESRHSPPELTLDYGSDSDEEHMPPSPPNLTINHLSAKQSSSIDTSALYPALQDTKHSALQLPEGQQPTIIAAY